MTRSLTFEDLTGILATYRRIAERAANGKQMEAWGLKRRIPEPGSLLATDDDVPFELLPDFNDPHLVSGTAVFPVMAATYR